MNLSQFPIIKRVNSPTMSDFSMCNEEPVGELEHNVNERLIFGGLLHDNVERLSLVQLPNMLTTTTTPNTRVVAL